MFVSDRRPWPLPERRRGVPAPSCCPGRGSRATRSSAADATVHAYRANGPGSAAIERDRSPVDHNEPALLFEREQATGVIALWEVEDRRSRHLSPLALQATRRGSRALLPTRRRTYVLFARLPSTLRLDDQPQQHVVRVGVLVANARCSMRLHVGQFSHPPAGVSRLGTRAGAVAGMPLV